MKNNKLSVVFICLVLAIVVAIVATIVCFKPSEKKDTMTVGVILPGSKGEYGWNGVHAQAVEEACSELGVDVKIYENIKEYSGKCAQAVEEMADANIGIIILESYNYPEEIEDTITAHPEISFYCCSEKKAMPNYAAYFARVYQARYLSGIVAGMTTKSNVIGYVAAMSNSEVNRGINAFALGVQRVNPDAKVEVKFTGTWDDEEKEKQSAYILKEKAGADVLAYHQNRPFVVEAAEEMGIDVIGYNMHKGDYSEHLLTSVVSDWSKIYREIIGEYMRKKQVSVPNYWIGVEDDAVGLDFYSDEVTEEIKNEVDKAKSEMESGYEVFSGVIYDNNGEQRCNEGEVISDDVLLQQMDWFAEGVEIYEENQ
jgi:basic membrane protein A